MLQIRAFAVDHQTKKGITDERHPVFNWYYDSDRQEDKIAKAVLTVGDISVDVTGKNRIRLKDTHYPKRVYRALLEAESACGDKAAAELTFETALMGRFENSVFITDGTYVFKEKHVSPKVMVFRKTFSETKPVASARLYITAIGVYRADLNGQRVGEDFFTPGFTSYKTTLQYQTYDVTHLLRKENRLEVTVAGGWAVGSFVYSRKNRITADRQALQAELHVTYTDGSEEVTGTDETWQVTTDGPITMSDLYDGETFDGRIDTARVAFHPAVREKVKIDPQLVCQNACVVRRQEVFEPVSITGAGEEDIYDFGQNFAGILHLEIEGEEGQEILIRHAEILHPDGTLQTDFLRSAKATLTYLCRAGHQEYEPSFTYMGFRYISVKGISRDKIRIRAYALYSNLTSIGSFSCSDERINRLQENIRWGAKSNFVEIPTDCPQRDERMGWTGDIALFAPAACFNFDMSGFLEKWLKDMRAEQAPTGGIPNTVPSQGFGFPVTMPNMAIDFWGDACILVPYAEYMARGDLQILRDNYPMMKKYVKACRFWAGLFSFGEKRYIWDTLASLHFGDWVAPDAPTMQDWQKRSKWTATASLCNTSRLLSRIAGLLGEEKDEKAYRTLSDKVAKAYRDILTDKNGRLLQEFQTAYVLPIHFGMLPEQEEQKAAERLAELSKENGYRIGTGFPGTPYILFALADHGQEETAYKMLTCTECPSWLYEVRMGATTVWERWDGLNEEGNCPISNDGVGLMISYNHYASGAVADFFYKRIAGIEPLEGGYRRFRIKPLPGGDLTFAKAEVMTPYGQIRSEWERDGDKVTSHIKVPFGTNCEWILPDGSSRQVTQGFYETTVYVQK